MSAYVCAECGCSIRPGPVYRLRAELTALAGLPDSVSRRTRRAYDLCQFCAPAFPDARLYEPPFRAVPPPKTHHEPHWTNPRPGLY
jgi:hypothetical protein